MLWGLLTHPPTHAFTHMPIHPLTHPPMHPLTHPSHHSTLLLISQDIFLNVIKSNAHDVSQLLLCYRPEEALTALPSQAQTQDRCLSRTLRVKLFQEVPQLAAVTGLPLLIRPCKGALQAVLPLLAAATPSSRPGGGALQTALVLVAILAAATSGNRPGTGAVQAVLGQPFLARHAYSRCPGAPLLRQPQCYPHGIIPHRTGGYWHNRLCSHKRICSARDRQRSGTCNNSLRCNTTCKDHWICKIVICAYMSCWLQEGRWTRGTW